MTKARTILRDVLGSSGTQGQKASRDQRRQQAPVVEMYGERAQTFIVQGDLHLYAGDGIASAAAQAAAKASGDGEA